MKRTFVRRNRTPDYQPNRQLSADQLSGIGDVALAYNYASTALDRAMAAALDLPANLYLHVCSRINGTDGQKEIIKETAKEYKFDNTLQRYLAETLGNSGFKLLKQYRDGIVHSRVLDAYLGLGEVVEHRGRHSEVILDHSALETLALHLKAVSIEISAWIMIFIQAHAIFREDDAGRDTEPLLEEFQEYCSQYLSYRTDRLSLRPLPKFPEGSEFPGPSGA